MRRWSVCQEKNRASPPPPQKMTLDRKVQQGADEEDRGNDERNYG